MNRTPFESIFHGMKKPWVTLLYTLLVVLVYYFVDKPMATYFHHLDLRSHGYGLREISLLGQSLIYIVSLSLAGLYFRYLKVHPVYEAWSW